MRLSQMFKDTQQQNLTKDSLDRYKKKSLKSTRPQNFQKLATQSTSKNQFIKYFLDTVNVFYEDRQTLKNLQQTQIKLKIFLPLWFFLAILYMITSRIQPFEGACPEHATCKVFIRCNPGYELSEDRKRCNVKASIIQQIENVCKFEIQTLAHEFGDADCMTNVTNPIPPYKRISELTDSITKTVDQKLSVEIELKVHNFLNNATNQAEHSFEISGGKVFPLSKKHTFKCWLQLSSQTTEFKVVAVVFVLLSILGGWYSTVYARERKVKEIYQYLKNKVMDENKVNVTLLNDQIKLDFGAIDQNMWIKIDEERQKDGRIGYFEDEFLFWKLM